MQGIQQRHVFRQIDVPLARPIRLNIAADIEGLVDALIEKGADHPDVKDERMPYWAELWPSAVGLARYLQRNPELVQGKSVVELGCGPGLPGIAALREGAEVCFTDYESDALELAAWNAAENGFAISGPEPAASTVLLDWREPPDQQWDVILASDVAYETRNFEALIACFDKLLRPDGILLLSEPKRPIARPFEHMLSDAGFEIQSTEEPVVTLQNGASVRIHLGRKISASGG